MAQTPSDQAIVTYRSLGHAFEGPAAQRLTEASPFESLQDPAEETALRAELSSALAALETETARQGPGMMAAVPNQLASLIQSRMLEGPPPGDPMAIGSRASAIILQHRPIHEVVWRHLT